MDALDRIADWIREARNAWAFTGAGVSTESGIPDFRSADSGLWAQTDPMEVASLDGFLRDTPRFYAFWHWRFAMLDQAEPGATHRWLAALEDKGRLRGVITQNIDGLHVTAGSNRVYELHGSFRRGACVTCGRGYEIEQVLARAQADGKPRCDGCAGLLKPDVVLFGETLPVDFYEACAALQRCDLLLVLGTSLEVFPAADLVPQVKRAGGRVALLNREPTPMDDLVDAVARGELGQLVAGLVERGAGFLPAGPETRD